LYISAVPGGQAQLQTVSVKQTDIAVFIGPEGGFEDEEVELARENGAEIAVNCNRTAYAQGGIRVEAQSYTVLQKEHTDGQ
jgi:predicted amidohydrolase